MENSKRITIVLDDDTYGDMIERLVAEYGPIEAARQRSAFVRRALRYYLESLDDPQAPDS